MGIDVPGISLTIRPDGGVPAFPQVVTDLRDASCARLAPLPFAGLECAGSGLAGHCRCFCDLGFADSLVNPYRRCAAHFVGDVGVDVQRGAAGDMTNDGRECFDVHAMLQACCGKYMAQVVESNLFTLSSL